MFDKIDLGEVNDKIKRLEATITRAKELVIAVTTFQRQALDIAKQRASLESELVSVKSIQKDNKKATKTAIKKLKSTI